MPPVTRAEAARELLARREAVDHCAGYARYVHQVMPAVHHEQICEALDSLLADAYDELIILAPPGSAKSTYTSHVLPSYFLGHHPQKNVILGTHTSDLSERWSRRVRNTFASPEHQLVFPDAVLSKDSTAVSRWATSEGGEFLAAGVGGSILGFRADLGILDDPISGFEQAQSLTQLQKVHDWYETDFVTRLKPGAKTVLICQRLARNDLAGYLIDRNLENPTKRQRILKFQMVRPDGSRLWPEWFTEEMVKDAQRDDFKWRTLYQQEPPSDTGAWVSSDEIKIVDIVPSNLNRYILSDLALSVNKGDYSVHLVVGVGDNGHAFIVDAWRSRCSPEQTAAKHLELVSTYAPSESLIDDDNASKVYMQLLASMAREASTPVPWKTMPMRGQDKETRAAPLRGMFKRGMISLKRESWNEWLVKELLNFPNALGDGVDDGVDALGLIGRRLASLASAAPQTVVAPKGNPLGTLYDATLDQLWEAHDLSRTGRGRRL
jgi:predicted phage terminase large subunit-like protein